jgi:hypothetical protein
LILSAEFLLPGETVKVCINGPAEFGDEAEFVMQSVTRQEVQIWMADVMLPFRFQEKCHTGVFQVRYAVDGHDGSFYEGSPPEHSYRILDEVQRHYYHTFKLDVSVDRCRGRIMSLKVSDDQAAEEALGAAMQEVFENRTQGQPELFLERVDAMLEDFSGSFERSMVERLFDELLAEYQAEMRSRPELILCMLGALGAHGLSSGERSWVSTGGYGGSSTYSVTAGGGGHYVYHSPPLPGSWEKILMEMGVVTLLFPLNLRTCLGAAHFEKGVAGLVEMQERFAEHDSWQWLPLMAIIRKHYGKEPRLKSYYGKAAGANLDRYEIEAKRLLRSVSHLHEEAMQRYERALAHQQAQQQAQQQAGGAGGRGAGAGAAAATRVVTWQQQVGAQLARELLKCAIAFAPSLELINVLLSPENVLTDGGEPSPAGALAVREYHGMLGGELQSYVEDMDLADEGEESTVEQLQLLLLGHDGAFCSPSLACAMLRNDDLGGRDASSRTVRTLLHLVELCIPDRIIQAMKFVPVAGQSSHDDVVVGRAEMTELVKGLKKWIETRHQTPPVDYYTNHNAPVSYSGSWVGEHPNRRWVKDTGPPPPPEEMASRQAQCARECLDDVDKLFRLKGGAMMNTAPAGENGGSAADGGGSNPLVVGLLHEITRCHFLKGESLRALGALVAVASSNTSAVQRDGRVKVGERVKLANPTNTVKCLKSGADVGKLCKDDRTNLPFQVEAHGVKSWYKLGEIVRAAEPESSSDDEDTEAEEADALARYTSPLQSFVRQHGVRLVAEASSERAKDYNYDPSDGANVARTITSSLSVESHFGRSLALALLHPQAAWEMEALEETTRPPHDSAVRSNPAAQAKAQALASEVALGQVLINAENWRAVMEWCGGAEAATRPTGDVVSWAGEAGKGKGLGLLGQVLLMARSRLLGAAGEAQSATITLSRLKEVIRRSYEFSRLLTYLGAVDEERGSRLHEHRLNLQRFDTTLAQLKQYIAFFCAQPTVKIDVVGLHQLTTSLRSRYSQIHANEIVNNDLLPARDAVGSLTGSLAASSSPTSRPSLVAAPVFEPAIPPSLPCVVHLPWLHALRTSGLFLGLWRRCGRALCMEQAMIGGGVSDANAVNWMAPGAIERFMRKASLDRLNSPREAPQEEAPTIPAGFGGAMAQGAAEDEEPVEEQAAAAEGRMVTRAEEVVLSQELVCHTLLPMVQREWGRLFDGIRTLEISVTALDKACEGVPLGSEKKLRNELAILTATAAPFSSVGPEGARTATAAATRTTAGDDGSAAGGSGGPTRSTIMSPREVAALAPTYTDCTFDSLHSDYEWMDESLSRIGDYLLLGRLRTLLPSLISLRMHVGPLLMQEERSDDLFNRFSATLAAIEQATTAAEQQEARMLRAAEQRPAFVFGAAPEAAGAAAGGVAGEAFQAADSFTGLRPGYVFKEGEHGLGYYREGFAAVAAAIAAGECWACPGARSREAQCGACLTDWSTPESVARAAALLAGGGADGALGGAGAPFGAAAVVAAGGVAGADGAAAAAPGAEAVVVAPTVVRFDLGSLMELLKPIRAEIRGLEANGPEILEFMSLLGDCPMLVQWLLDHADTSEFNRLLQVCKSSTDDSRALKSLASIVHVRTLLLPILYPASTTTGQQKDQADGAQANHQPVLQDFHEFLSGCENELLVAAAAAAEREREGKKKKGNKARAAKDEHTESGLALHVRHLHNVVSNFDHLLTVFSSSTRSPGIKALHELHAIATRGTFTFLTNAAPGSDTSADGAAESNSTAEQQGGGARFLVRLKATEKQEPSSEVGHPQSRLAKHASASNEKGEEEKEEGENAKEKEADEANDDDDEEAEGAGASEGAIEASSMSMEELMDLRSKLMMTEVPVELEEQLQLPGGTLADYVKVFAEQVQLAIEIQLTLEQLQRIGHVDYQGSFAWTLPPMSVLVANTAASTELPLDEGLRRMRAKGQHLDEELEWWRKEVGVHRERFYFLNYFTMLEVLRLANLCEAVSKRVEDATSEGVSEVELRKMRREQRIERLRRDAKAAAKAAGRTGPRRRRRRQEGAAAAGGGGGSGGGGAGGAPNEGPDPLDNDPRVDQLALMGFSRNACKTALRSTNNVDAALDYIFSHPEVMALQDDDPEEDAGGGAQEDSELQAALAASVAMSPGGTNETAAVAEAESATDAEAGDGEDKETEEEDDWYEDLFGWGAAEESAVGASSLQREPEEELNAMLHLVLSTVDDSRVHEAVRRWKDKPVESKEEEEDEAVDEAVDEAPSSASIDVLKRVGQFLNHIFEGGSNAVTSRRVPLPSTTQNDLLITVRTKDGRSLPVWVACAPSPAEVIDVVLSVFARRGRLPEPGELLFCTTDTTIEQVEVLMRRFLHAEQHARSQCVFVVADVHMLTYTKQCAVVELLRRLLDEYGSDAAASLLLLSGRPHQVIINQLSSQMQDLPALEEEELRQVCRHAFIHHVGETRAVVSTINGGGKTHWIMAHVAERQQKARERAATKSDGGTGSSQLLYRRVPVRENTTPAALASLLSASMAAATAARLLSADASADDDDDVSFVFHLDIGHIVPACVNTMLFQLLVLGTLNSDDRVYHRSTRDVFLIEIPNSPNNATAHALRFCGLLPTKKLQVNRHSLSLKKPEFVDHPWCMRIGLPDYSSLMSTCKMLRAIEAEKFNPRAGGFDVHWSVHTAGELTVEECFDILVKHCCDEDDDPPVNIAALARDGGAAAAAAGGADVRPEDIAAAADAAGGGNGINEGPMRPSFQLFANFVLFVSRQFGMVDGYPLLNHAVLINLEDLQAFRHVFCRLLVKTAQDFTLRSVPQLTEVGIVPFDDEEQQAAESEDLRMFSSAAGEREKQRERRRKQRLLLQQGAVGTAAQLEEAGGALEPQPEVVVAEADGKTAAAEAEAQAALDAAAAALLGLNVGDEVEARAFGGQHEQEQAHQATDNDMPLDVAAQLFPVGEWERAMIRRVRDGDGGDERTYDIQFVADTLHEAGVSGRFIRPVDAVDNEEAAAAAAEVELFAMIGMPTSEQIAAMEYEQLCAFASSLGLEIPPDADRNGVVEMVQPIAAYEVERNRDQQRVTLEALREQRQTVRAAVVAQQQANGIEEDEEEGGNDELARPGLVRQFSGEFRRQMMDAEVQNEGRNFGAMAGAMAAGGMQIADRFEQMHSWEDSKHPIVVFKQAPHNGTYGGYGGGVDGVDILSLNPRFCDEYISREMQRALDEQGLKLDKDWGKLTNEEGMRVLRGVDGVSDAAAAAFADELNNGYVLTVDNLLKMLSILLRLLCGLPAVVMGETGCGKSSLVKQLCAVVGFELHTLNVHGGLESADIIEWVSARVDESLNGDDMVDDYGGVHTRRVMLFLDEINTCNCMGLFKEIVCEHSVNGKQLPQNVSVIAACNPYRLRKGILRRENEAGGGLMFEHHHGGGGGEGGENVGTGIKDPLRDLVYRVHPLPEAMTDHIFDFGALTAATERLYIIALLRRQLAQYVPDADEDVDGEMLEQQEQVRRTGTYYAGYSWFETRNIATPFAELIECFAHLICAAQEFVRELAGGERSAASLRDVSRCVIVYRWFGEHFAAGQLDETNFTVEEFFSADAKARPWIKRSMVMALSYCYHARLPHEERERLLHRLVDSYGELQRNVQQQQEQQPQGGAAAGGRNNWNRGGQNAAAAAAAGGARRRPQGVCAWLNFTAVHTFQDTIERTQLSFVNQMRLGPGIAKNEALKENLFMVLISILNQIPIFVVGKPGSSKSLALGLLQANLNGQASENAFLKTLPTVEVFSYQCSPLSTSGGIEQVFSTARKFNAESQNTLSVVLLDEVGLAEQSPHLPLKVLHKLLDEALPGDRLAVVGISNWGLDPAKMNRAVHLCRPAPSVDDLAMTAEGMVANVNLKGYLNSLARGYHEVYSSQHERPDFWGLREFYSCVKVISTELDDATSGGSGDGGGVDGGSGGSAIEGGGAGGTKELSRELLMRAVLRNFGGRPWEMPRIMGTFFDCMQYELTSRDVLALQAMSGAERASGAASSGSGVTPVKVGSSAPAVAASSANQAQSEQEGHESELVQQQQQHHQEEQMARESNAIHLIRSNLRDLKARHLMLLTRNGAALPMLFEHGILSHNGTDIIFGSDFPLDKTDMQVCLNIQRIKNSMAEGRTVVLVHCDSLYESLYDLLNQHYTEYAGQQYVRLAFGTHSRLCPIAENFRVVVVVEKVEAYTTMAPPLLNRFEKQVFERKNILSPTHLRLKEHLESFAYAIARSSTATRTVEPKADEHPEGPMRQPSFKAAAQWDVAGGGGVRTGAMTAEEEGDFGRASGLGESTSAASQWPGSKAMRRAFCGYHPDLLSSLALAVKPPEIDMMEDGGDGDEGSDEGAQLKRGTLSRSASTEVSQLKGVAMRKLLWIATPEAVCRLMSPGPRAQLLSEYAIDPAEEYFARQCHSNLALFCTKMLPTWGKDGDIVDGEGMAEASAANTTSMIKSAEAAGVTALVGAQVLVMTHSPMRLGVVRLLMNSAQLVDHTDGASEPAVAMAAAEAAQVATSAAAAADAAAGSASAAVSAVGDDKGDKKDSSMAASPSSSPSPSSPPASPELAGALFGHDEASAPPPLQLRSISHVALHELTSERDLVSRVQAFFNEGDGSGTKDDDDTSSSNGGPERGDRLLVVQCDPLATSLRRIEHAKFICETARARAMQQIHTRMKQEQQQPVGEGKEEEEPEGKVEEEDEGKVEEDDQVGDGASVGTSLSQRMPRLHVMLLLHLPRGSEAKYSADFGREWRCAFVDAMEPEADTGIPVVEALIGKTLPEVVAGLRLGKVLARNFRPALASVRYPYSRGILQVRSQIQQLLRLLEEEDFLQAVRAAVQAMLAAEQEELQQGSGIAGGKQSLLETMAVEESGAQTAGGQGAAHGMTDTFQAALHRQVISAVCSAFAVCLAHMDRNQGLAMLTDSTLPPKLRDAWLLLFNQSITSGADLQRARQRRQQQQQRQPAANANEENASTGNVIDVLNDGHEGQVFCSRFPYSFNFHQKLESLRSFEAERAVRAQAGLLGVPEIFCGKLSEGLLRRYVYDFTHMQLGVDWHLNGGAGAHLHEELEDDEDDEDDEGNGDDERKKRMGQGRQLNGEAKATLLFHLLMLSHADAEAEAEAMRQSETKKQQDRKKKKELKQAQAQETPPSSALPKRKSSFKVR